MMIFFESESSDNVLPIWEDSSNNNNKFCIHCSILLPQSQSIDDNYGNNKSFNLDSSLIGAAEVQSSTTATSQWLKGALFSIFKMNYLNAFDVVREDQIDENILALCENCNQMLSNLHQRYNDFIELGKINSYLHKKLQRLDEIIDRHQQKTIKCDLIIAPFFQKEDDTEGCNFVNEDEPSISVIANKSKKNKIEPPSKTTTTKSSLLVNNGREPRIVLTRLPEKYIRRQQAEKLNKDNMENQFSDRNSAANSSHNDGDDPNDYLEKVPKVEVVENALVDEDYDYFQQSPSSEASSEDNHPQSTPKKCRKNVKKSTTRKQESTQKRRGRPAKLVNNSSHKKSSLGSTNRKRSCNKGSPLKSVKKSKNSGKSLSIKPNRTKTGINCYIRHSKYFAKKTRHPNPCWYCRKYFATPADCFEHTKQEHLPENCDRSSTSPIVICERCSRICFTDRELQRHLRKCEFVPPGKKLPAPFPCPQCPKTFGDKSELKSHMMTHTDDRPFTCDECSYGGKTLSLLQRHKFARHSVHPVFKCDECDSVLKSELLLKGHKFRMHTLEGQEQYKRHQATASAKVKEQRKLKAMSLSTICADCNLDCFSRLSFINHRRTFHGERVGDFVCEICGQEFTRKDALQDHKKFVHSDARPFLCTQCGKSFKQSYHLRHHEKAAHTEEGRLAYNRQIRECSQRRKMRQNHLAHIAQQAKQQQQQHQSTAISNSLLDYACLSQNLTNNN